MVDIGGGLVFAAVAIIATVWFYRHIDQWRNGKANTAATFAIYAFVIIVVLFLVLWVITRALG